MDLRTRIRRVRDKGDSGIDPLELADRVETWRRSDLEIQNRRIDDVFGRHFKHLLPISAGDHEMAIPSRGPNSGQAPGIGDQGEYYGH